MNLIEIASKKTSSCLTISAFKSHFGNCEYSLLSPNRPVTVQYIFGQAEKNQLDFSPLYNTPEKTVT